MSAASWAQTKKEILQKARTVPARELSEYEKREAALAMQEEILRKVTRRPSDGSESVTGASERDQTAAGGRAGRAEAIPQVKKITGSSAAARAPEAAARMAEKTKPNKKENEFMLNLMILRNTLQTNAPSCRDRARLAGKWVWRDIRLMLTLVDRIRNALLLTMPESRDDYYTAYAKYGHYELHINGPVKTTRHLLITDRHLAAMAEAAMKSECILCMREGSEISQCPLREALLETAAPTDLQDGRWDKCEYRDAAGALVQGKEVTV